jgi:hypothetical protein
MGQYIKTITAGQTGDFDIQALVDSQLGWEEEKRVWQDVENDPALTRRYQELVSQKKLLLQWWAEEESKSLKKGSSKDKRETLLV